MEPYNTTVRLETPVFVNTLDILSQVLVLVGALNWGLIGINGYNLVSDIFGGVISPRILYMIVGGAGLVQIIKLLKFLGDVSPRQDIQAV